MKRLFLFRHAKSSWDHPGMADHERPLNKRGKCDAPLMGRRLAEQGVKPDLIMSSPAKRAIKTAKAVAKALGYPKEKIEVVDDIYSEGAPDILRVIQRADDRCESLMLFGHNPDFTELANCLSGEHIEHMPTCSVVCIDFGVGAWRHVAEDGGTFVFFGYPKQAQ